MTSSPILNIVGALPIALILVSADCALQPLGNASSRLGDADLIETKCGDSG